MMIKTPQTTTMLLLATLGSLPTACDDPGDVEDVRALDPAALAASRELALIESLRYLPSSERFEYTGHIDDLEAAWRHGPDFEPPESDGVDSMDVLTRDGRTYRQRPGPSVVRSSQRSRLVGTELAELGSDADVEDDVRFRNVGVDGRTIVTGTAKQDVTVRLAMTSTSTGGICSASMISPRVFLTAAHCLTDGSGNWSADLPDVIMPSARGKTYSGNNNTLDADDTPFGARQIVRYVKPVPWTGTGLRYDYALVVVGDLAPDLAGSIQWDPQPAAFGTEPCDDIVGDNVNVRGYPGPNNTCADPWPEDGTSCGGYAFTESGSVVTCTEDELRSCHFGQGGQSGGPLYKWNAGAGVRTVLGVIKGGISVGGSTFFRFHRIRPASFNTVCNVVEDPDNQSSYFTNVTC